MLKVVKSARSAIKKLEDELSLYVKLYVQNKDFSLEDRWAVFREAKCGSREPWAQHFSVIEDEARFTLYDDFYIEKYETIYTIVLVDRMQEKETEDEDGTENLDGITVKLKEEVLDKFIWNFRNDW